MDQRGLETSIVRDRCRQSFKTFVEEFWDTVPGAQPLQWNWHMDVLCQELQEVAERVFAGEEKDHDTVINISPGTSKSSICSILFHPWTWTRMPHARHLNASHTADLVLDLAYKAREVIRSERYQELFPEIELCGDADAKSLYRNTRGGDRLACTVAGKSPMGFHAHFLMVDDPIDPKKAVSEVELKSAKEFMSNILPSRKVDKKISVTVLIMQRLHRDDPTAVLLDRAKKEDGGIVRHFCLPAELYKGDDGVFLEGNVSPKYLAQKYTEGDRDGLMDSTRLGRKTLRELRATLGAYAYAGQFEQNPTPLGGGMFKEHWFNQRVKAAPYHARRVRFWDRASTADGGCATAGVLIAEYEGNWYIEDVVWGQWEPDERNSRMKATALRDRAKYGPRNAPIIAVEAEGGSSGVDAFKGVARILVGFSVIQVRVTGSKDVRAEPWAAQCAAGNVYLVDNGESEGTGQALWDVAGFVQEHVMFKPEPGTKRLGLWKDRVDGASGGFNYLVRNRTQSPLRTYSLGPSRQKFHVVVCNPDDLASFITEHRAIMVNITDPISPTEGLSLPPMAHGLNKLLDSHLMLVADIQPADYQENWDTPVERFGKKPEELILDQQGGKKLWAFLLKKRDPAPELFVISDMGGEDRRALSVALAIVDTMGLPRTVIHIPSDEERFSHSDNSSGEKPGNQHLYDMVRATRGMVSV